MPIDFGKLGASNLLDTATEPTTIFAALASRQYQYLRNVQGEVLDGWHGRRNERDLVLKMNTGAGKTVVGLLILKSCINERVGPAAYLTPDNFLADQVVLEAGRLGIEVTREIDQRYLSGKAILVDNIKKLVNGRSKFGINGNTPLQSVLIDDAHSCLRIAEEQCTLKLPFKHDAYKELFALFRTALEQQSRVTVLDVEAGDPTKMMEVPFWSWRDQQQQVTSILHKHRLSPEMEWEWPLVKDSLPNCTCIFGGRGLSISSRCLNIGLLRDFENAKRRIYTTATLADDSALVTHFNAKPSSVETPITPKNAADIGDRMILAPQELNPAIKDEEIKTFLKWVAGYVNVVVIVPSGKRAKFWADVAAQTLTAENLAAGTAALRNGLVGLTVLVNKYDGVDLPGNACRVLVIDQLPEVERPLDRLDASVLEDSETMLAKHVQRIEQGMGRGVRANDDHCVVLLLGARLVTRVGLPAAQTKFTPATRAQLELSRKVAEQVAGKPLTEIYTDAMLLCLNQDQRWVTASRAAVAGVGYAPAEKASKRSVRMRAAFDAALLDRYAAAVAEMQIAVREETDPRVQGWLKQLLADVTHVVDPAGAQQIQLGAQKLNRLVLRPVSGVEYVKLAPSTRSQAETLAAFLKDTYGDMTKMLLGYNAILDELIFQDDSFRRFEAAMQHLGEHLGFKAHRPEIEFGNGGPDNLWALGGQRFVMIECKNEATSEFIPKAYCDKSAGRRHWFEQSYGPGCTADSIMVHPSRLVSHYAMPDPTLRIMTPSKLDDLKTACRTLAKNIALTGFADVDRIGKTLDSLGLTAEKLTERFSEPFELQPKPHPRP